MGLAWLDAVMRQASQQLHEFGTRVQLSTCQMHVSSSSRHVAWVTVGRLSDFMSTSGMGHGRTCNSRVVGPQAG
eukprot:13248774-Alexandrium_andersonii.AAC.1